MSICKVWRTGVYRPWTIVQESSRLYFTICTLAHLCSCCFRHTTTVYFLVVGLQLVTTPVKYDYNSIEKISTCP